MSYENRYRRYLSSEYYFDEQLEDTPHRGHRPSPVAKILGYGAIAAGLAAGGYYLFRRGRLRGLVHNLISNLGSYQGGAAEDIFTGLRRWADEGVNIPSSAQRQADLIDQNIQRGGQGLVQRFREGVREIVRDVHRAPELATEIQDELTRGTIRRNTTQAKRAVGIQEPSLDRPVDTVQFLHDRDLAMNQYSSRGGAFIDVSGENYIRDQTNQNFINSFRFDATREAELLRNTGFRHATLKDLMDADQQNLLQANNPNAVQRWIQQVDAMSLDAMEREYITRGINPDELWGKVADPNILIDEKGKLVDLRRVDNAFRNVIDSLSNDFQIPFIGINPLKMGFVDQIFNVDRMPHITLLNHDSRQPAVFGHNMQIQEPLLYIQGNVHRIYDLPSLRQVGLNRGDLVATGGYLLPSKGGSIPRLFRKMSGIETTTFTPPGPNASFWHRMRWDLANRLDIGLQDEPLGGNNPLDVNSIFYYLAKRVNQNFPAHAGITYHGRTSQAYGHTDYVFMRKHRTLRDVGVRGFFDNLIQGNFNQLDSNAAIRGGQEWLSQFFAGRQDLTQVTTSSFIPFAFFERLNATLNLVGMGFNLKHTGSATQLFGAFITRRILPIAGAIAAWNYFNYEVENLTGVEIDDTMARAYAGANIGLAHLRDFFGLTAIGKKLAELTPGSEQIYRMPGLRIFDWTKDAQETREYWERGESPVRRGRWWPMGNCIHPETEIQLADGTIRQAQEVQVGQLVLTHLGVAHRVLHVVTRQMREGEYSPKVFLHGFPIPIITTDNHPYLAVIPKDCIGGDYDKCRPDRPCSLTKTNQQCINRADWSPDWIFARYLNAGDYLAYPRIKFGGELTSFEEIPLNHETGFLLGMILAEGNIDKRVNNIGYSIKTTHHINERNLAERIDEIVFKYFKVKGKISLKGKNTIKYRVCSVAFTKWVSKMIYDGPEKIFPRGIQGYSEEFAIGLLKGMFEGDGHLQLAGRDSLQMILTAKRLNHIIAVRNILFSFGLDNMVVKHQPGKPFSHCLIYRIIVTGDSAKTLYRLINYTKPLPTSTNLSGRSSKNAYFDENYVYLRIQSIEDSGYRGLVYDYEIEEAHSFCGLSVVLHNTAFTGGRVEAFEPNWVRKTISDWQFTDTLYGSKDEFWSQAPIPTPRFPLAPIRHFITNPYHYERKHYHDRPYLITGGIPALEEFPLIGPLLSSTIGQILKPQRRMHPEVWASLGEKNQIYAAGIPQLETQQPNDRFYERQWHMNKMQIDQAWAGMGGGQPREVTVAVLDTGVDASHPDLRDNILPGFNAFTGDTNVTDKIGHGTHVAGIIAASGNNTIGVAGVAHPVVNILPIKVLDDRGWGTDETLERGLEHAINWRGRDGSRVDIINLSLGMNQQSLRHSRMIQRAHEEGILVVASAGNEGTPWVGSPAHIPEAMAVGALDKNYELAYFSNYGEDLDITAPGVDIFSTVPTRGRGSAPGSPGYGYMSGTSMAAPIVTSVAALLKVQQPDLTPGEMRYILQGTAQDLGRPGWDRYHGSGAVDPMHAVNLELARTQIAQGGQQMEATIDQQRRDMLNALRATATRQAMHIAQIADEFGRPIQNPGTVRAGVGRFFRSMAEMAGFYGFAAESVAGRNIDESTIMADSRAITSYRRQFWDMQLGGFGGDVNEIGRRFIGKREKWDQRFNPIPNTMPSWLPGEEYFINFRVGDPYCLEGDSLVEVGNLQFVPAKEVEAEEILLDCKGNKTSVIRVAKRAESPTVSLKIATLSSFPMTSTLDHPVLTRKLVLGRDRKARVKIYEYANLLLKELERGSSRIKACTDAQIPPCVAHKCWKLLSEHGKIELIYHGRRADVKILDATPFDMDLVNRGLVFVQAQEIEVGDYVAYPKLILPETITSIDLALIAPWKKVTDTHVYANNNHSWPRYIELTPELGFFAGLWCAEGTAQKSGAINMAHHISERDVVMPAYSALGLSPTWRPTPNTNGAQTTLGHKGLATFLIWLCGQGALNKCLHEQMFNMPKEFITAFLDGLFFGDGCSFVSHNRARKSLKTASKALALQVRKLLLALGIVAGIITNPPSQNKAGSVSKQNYAVNINNQEKGTQWFQDEAYYYFRVSSKEQGPIVETYGFMTSTQTFCAAGIATHNTKLPDGEIRLPGEAYESLYPVPEVAQAMQDPNIRRMVEEGIIHRGELYGPLTRFRILADVAPYSDEFKMQSKIVSGMNLSEEDKEEVRQIREQVRARRETMRLYNYNFNYSDIRQELVTVQRVLDNNLIVVEEYDNPLRLAGISIPTGASNEKAQEARAFINKMIKPGMRIRIGVDDSPETLINDDTYQTISAVVFHGGVGNLNRELIRRGMATERERDFSPAAMHVRFTGAERAIGSLWERIAHKDSPFHTKFLQVRSPLESYKRRDLYGKNWQTWNDPIKDFVIPTYESFIAGGALSLAAATFLGAQFGATKFGAIIGMTLVGGSVALGMMGRISTEAIEGERWIPERREREREFEEYVDMLKFVKHRKLYRKYADLAQDQGINVELIIEDNVKQNKDRLAHKEFLEGLKRRLVVDPDDEGSRLISQINAELRRRGFEYVQADDAEQLFKNINRHIARLSRPIKPELESEAAVKAYEHYQASEATMFAFDPGDSIQNALRALPRKDRRYLRYFMDAPAEDREEILEVVPDYTKRVLQAVWGREVDPKPDIVEYFTENQLPDADWGGWRENVSIDDIKVKIIRREGLDASEHDIWPDDKASADMKNFEAPRMNTRERADAVRARLNDLLGGAGVEDLDIEVSYTSTGTIDIDMDISRDRRRDFRQTLNSHKRRIFGGEDR